MSRPSKPQPPLQQIPDRLAATQLRTKKIVLALLAAVFLWSYWPTMLALVDVWWNVDDYSHGFLVVPVAGLFLWLKHESLPTIAPTVSPAGLVMILAAAAMRWLGASYFIEAMDGWSMILWITGFVWLLGGWQLVRWAMPSIGFLFFMVPFPYRVETALSLPLQQVATKGSTWVLQSLGQPALQEGTTIIMGEIHLEVNRACAGLRMFIGVAALAYVFAVLSRRPWWDKLTIFASAIPIAILANVIRITTTALLYQVTENEQTREKIHDNAGLFTILVAALFFGIMTEYLKRLVVESQVISSRELVGTVSG